MPDAKSGLWNSLKERGWTPPPNKPYVQWTADELQAELAKYTQPVVEGLDEDAATKLALEVMQRGQAEMDADEAAMNSQTLEDVLAPTPPAPEDDWTAALTAPTPADEPQVPASAPEWVDPTPVGAVAPPAPEPVAQTQPVDHSHPLDPENQWVGVPRTDDPDTTAGLRMNSHGRNDAIRVDSIGRVWFQDEIRKPSTASPRARRVLRSRAPIAKTIEIRNELGLTEESFEVSSDVMRDTETKVTLPSWQVGIYFDPRLPFRVHVYNNIRGFDRLDVVEFYGGMDQVPLDAKHIYVGGDLCYDISSIRKVLEDELREKRLQIGSGLY